MQPKQFYEQKAQFTASSIKKLKQHSFVLSMLRLAFFLFIGCSIYLFYPWPIIATSAVLVSIMAFLFLIRKSADLKDKLNYYMHQKSIIEAEFKAMNGDYSGFNNGANYAIPNHDFSHDLDVFGPRSIFQMMNRTATPEGERYLADLLNENDILRIKEKQEALSELQNLPDDRLHFHAQAKVIEPEITPKQLVHYLKEYQSFIPKVWKYIAPAFTVISFVLLALIVFDFIPYSFLIYWFFIGILLSGRYIKKVTKVQQKLDKARYILLNYSKLIGDLESKRFNAGMLIEHHNVFLNKDRKYSQVLAKLYGYLNALDQRQNVVFAPIGAGLLLWDIQQMLKIEKWITEQHNDVEKLFDELAFFDAYYALAHYNFLNPTYSTPELTDTETIRAEGLIHALMRKENAVSNSIQINRGEFFIITGANMAGKSTFLRTIGTSIVLANLGLNVRAENFFYKPLRIITSMRTEDSLQDNESYFFAELQRLKYINDRLEKESCFVILDEILKGTNSKDKAEGSRKYVATLIQAKATGIIATHDLSLCELANEKPEISNYCFEALIENNELYFDYKFKEGICKNMNASFLLKKMGIVKD